MTKFNGKTIREAQRAGEFEKEAPTSETETPTTKTMFESALAAALDKMRGKETTDDNQDESDESETEE